MVEKSRAEPKGNRAIELVKEGGYQPTKGLGNSPSPKGGTGIRPRSQGNNKAAAKK